MKKVLAFAFLITALLVSKGAYSIGITAEGYARETPPGPSMSAAFVSLHNTGDSSQVLTGVELPGVEQASADLHTTISENGINRMRPLDQLTIAARASVDMAPGGVHLMIKGLRLQAGEELPLRLLFADGSSVDILVPIVRMSDEGEHHHHHHG
ncbi:copper chaperone PCu(A)C [Microbulbifer sp. ZKSA002]|uniref:copper chaperone PCu(A)C n=1 Tax=Microbulbifer sp. ZKSA002 TaxID=3243388 RepID=UPI00403A417D